MIDTQRSFDAPTGTGTGVLFPDRDGYRSTQQAESLFDRPDWSRTAVFEASPQRVIGFPDRQQTGPGRQPRAGFVYEQPVTPWYRAKRVWLAAALLLVAVALRFTLTPEPNQLQSAQLQSVQLQSGQVPVDVDR